jgi:hypothetical protein
LPQISSALASLPDGEYIVPIKETKTNHGDLMKRIKQEKEQRKEAEMKRFLKKKEEIDRNGAAAAQALE